MSVQGYKRLLQRYYALQAVNVASQQFTVLLVLPPAIDLTYVPKSNKQDTVSHELGIGYARLGIQLIACWMGLKTVWLMDDNVQDCYELQYAHMLDPKFRRHALLQRVSFARIMRTVEEQVRCTTTVLLCLAAMLHDHVSSHTKCSAVTCSCSSCTVTGVPLTQSSCSKGE